VADFTQHTNCTTLGRANETWDGRKLQIA
jgi:hypothetical protein